MKYFAYGSNMNLEQMKSRCPDSYLLGKGYVRDYRVGFTIFSPKRACGCADILESPGDEVWGLLYELSDSDIDRLDSYEAHPYKYRRCPVAVFDESGKVHHAQTYEVVEKSSEPLKPSVHYLGLMTNAARTYDFPQSYVSILESFDTLD